MKNRINLVIDKEDSEYKFFVTDDVGRKLDWREKEHIGKVDSFIGIDIFEINSEESTVPVITFKQGEMLRVYYKDRRDKYIFGVTDKEER